MSTSPASPAAISKQELLCFYDDFVEFQSSCTFLCDAIMAMTSAGLELDEAGIQGVHLYSWQIKRNVQELKDRLQALQEMDS